VGEEDEEADGAVEALQDLLTEGAVDEPADGEGAAAEDDDGDFDDDIDIGDDDLAGLFADLGGGGEDSIEASGMSPGDSG